MCDAFLKEHNFTPRQYFGFCHSLAYDTVLWMRYLGFVAEMRWIEANNPGRRTLITTAESRRRGAHFEWGFHCVVYYQRKVHDVWFGSPAYLAAYVRLMFPENRQISWRREPRLNYAFRNFSRVEMIYKEESNEF